MTENARSIWKKALEPGADCLSPDQFATGLNEKQTEHLQDCPRCQAEQALWRSFTEDLPAGEEAGAVRWVAAETERRLASKTRASSWSWLSGFGIRSWAAGLAAAGVVLMVGIYSRGPGLDSTAGLPDSTEVYRSATVQLLEPKGDLTGAPSQFRWTAMQGAAGYQVTLSEVDGTEMWSGESAEERLTIPAAVRARLLPGKTVVWKLTVRGLGGALLYHSPTERFRVKPKSIPGGE